jgi:hypothetical protein
LYRKSLADGSHSPEYIDGLADPCCKYRVLNKKNATREHASEILKIAFLLVELCSIYTISMFLFLITLATATIVIPHKKTSTN